jgi:hypothetical protein
MNTLTHSKAYWVLVIGVAVISADVFGDNTVTVGTSPTADITDWSDEYCVGDAQCDDFPNQQDGKGVCIASNYASPTPANLAFLRLDFDDVGQSGANTMDGCWLIDVDQDGNANRALCFSLSSTANVASSVTTTLYDCNDTDDNTCGGSMVLGSTSATCEFNNAVGDSDQLADCTASDSDLAVECSATLADLGWSSGDIGLLQGCVGVSNPANAATFDCFGSPEQPLIIDPETGDNTPVELQLFQVD